MADRAADSSSKESELNIYSIKTEGRLKRLSVLFSEHLKYIKKNLNFQGQLLKIVHIAY